MDTISSDCLDCWIRIGRGKELQFFATDAEVQEWLLHFLPQEYAPYVLLGADKIKEGKMYKDHPFQIELSEFVCCREGTQGKRYQFWIWSKTISPELKLSVGDQVDGLCSFNGLILLQHGVAHRGFQSASRIAITDQVRNTNTGEVRIPSDYLKVFNALRKEINKALVYSSIQVFTDGHEEEDGKLQRMTQKAVLAYHAGTPFSRKPGHVT